jgi:hypothetical protein
VPSLVFFCWRKRESDLAPGLQICSVAHRPERQEMVVIYFWPANLYHISAPLGWLFLPYSLCLVLFPSPDHQFHVVPSNYPFFGEIEAAKYCKKSFEVFSIYNRVDSTLLAKVATIRNRVGGVALHARSDSRSCNSNHH